MSVRTVLIEEHSRPICMVNITLRAGLLHDPPGKSGLANLTAQMLLRGAAARTQAQIADELDFLGSTLSVGVGRDTTTLEGDALTRNVDAFEALVADVLNEPTFRTEELDKLKRQTLAELVQVRDHDPSLARKHHVSAMYDGHEYARPLRGTEASVASITRDDVVAFYEAHYRQADAIVGGSSAIRPERLDTFVSRTLGRLPAEPLAPLDIDAHVSPPGYHVTLVDKPERSQTQVFIGHSTLESTHPDFIPLFVGHTIFGGTFTARLSHEIREKRGWSYGAYSYLQTDRRLGAFMMRFYPANKDTVPALRVTDELFHGLVSDGVTAKELEGATSYLANSHPMTIETPEKELRERLSAILHGRPDDWLDRFVEDVRAVTIDQVNDAIRRHLHPDNLTVTVVCTADDLRADLEAWGHAASVKTVAYDAPDDA